MNSFDLGWAAGWFEGEGSIISRPAGKGTIQLQAASTDVDTPLRFQALVGGRVYGPYGPYQANRQAHYRWDAYGHEAAAILRLLLPYFGERRKARAIAALVIFDERQAAPYYSRSRKGVGGRPTHKHVRERMQADETEDTKGNR